MKHIYIEDRCKRIAQYIIDTRCTVRKAAEHFATSKSTVYVDISERLMHEDRDLYFRCRQVLSYNKSIRHLRGGEATAKKFKMNK